MVGSQQMHLGADIAQESLPIILQESSNQMAESWPSSHAEMWISPAIIFLWMWNKSNNTQLVMAGYGWVTADSFRCRYCSRIIAMKKSAARGQINQNGRVMALLTCRNVDKPLDLQSSFYGCGISQTTLNW